MYFLRLIKYDKKNLYESLMGKRFIVSYEKQNSDLLTNQIGAMFIPISNTFCNKCSCEKYFAFNTDFKVF